MKKLDRLTLVQCIALAVLVLLLGTALYTVLHSRAGLSPAEKNHLFVALTFNNEELAQRLRLTKYFSGIASLEETGSETSVDIGRSYELWRRACADQGFAEVKQALGRPVPLAPASDYDMRASVPTPADKFFDEVQRALADDYGPQNRKASSVVNEAEKKPLTLAEKKQLFFDLTFHNEELRERLRRTKYFAETGAAQEKSSASWVDANQSYYLWRRACADKSFAEVKQALGSNYQFVPASYYWQGR
jgi:hypothetical protein